MKKWILSLAVLAGINGVHAASVDLKGNHVVDDEYVSSFRGDHPISVSKCISDMQQSDMEKIKKIDLSENTIMDTGVGTLKKKVWGTVQMFPNLETLNLSYNRITASALKDFLPLLKRDKFKYLDIFGNAAATIVGMDFFTKLDRSSLLKVIVIPKAWLDSATAAEGVLNLVKDRQDLDGLVDEMLKVHREYYGQKAE